MTTFITPPWVRCSGASPAFPGFLRRELGAVALFVLGDRIGALFDELAYDVDLIGVLELPPRLDLLIGKSRKRGPKGIEPHLIFRLHRLFDFGADGVFEGHRDR